MSVNAGHARSDSRHWNRWRFGNHGPSSPNTGGYNFGKQKFVGERLGGGKHKVDILVTTKQAEQILVSVKWQQVSGTAEQKVPFEIMCLADSIRRSQGRFKRAYLVLGGEGWKLREYYLHGNMREYLKNCDQVEIVSLEGFVAKANQAKL